jgi:hypothetical protein
MKQTEHDQILPWVKEKKETDRNESHIPNPTASSAALETAIWVCRSPLSLAYHAD